MFRFFLSLLRPILEYCSSIWSPCTKVSARKIEQIQHLAINMEKAKGCVFERHFESDFVSPVFQQFNLDDIGLT